jgi:hypothetical protein
MASLMDILAGAGNLLDLPGSSLRDLLSGRNPFDQWATPFSDVNRASGRDVLQPFLGANEETGMSGWMDNPMEGFKDIAGFGAEVLLDPLNLVPLGAVGKALKGRKAARKVNQGIDAVVKHPERMRLAQQMQEGFGESGTHTMNLLDSFAVHNKLPADRVHGRIDVGGVQNPMRETDTLFQTPVNPGYKSEPFYSKIMDAVDSGKIPNKVGREQLLKTLTGYGVKQEELADMSKDIDELFSGTDKVSKDDIFALAADKAWAQNQVEELTNWREPLQKQIDTVDELMRKQDLEFYQAKSAGNTELAQQILTQSDELTAQKTALYEQLDAMEGKPETGYAEFQIPGGNSGTYRELLLRNPMHEYRASHFDQFGFPDVQAHARVDEVTLPTGEKAMRIQEIQSDLHQKGAKEGYNDVPAIKQRITELEKERSRAIDELHNRFRSSNDPNAYIGSLGYLTSSEYRYAEELGRQLSDLNGELRRANPDAPFKKSWPELMAKIVLRDAAEKGYDTITLAPGEAAAKAVGGPPEALGKFYNDKMTNIFSKLVKKGGGTVEKMPDIATNFTKIPAKKEGSYALKTEVAPDFTGQVNKTSRWLQNDDNTGLELRDSWEATAYSPDLKMNAIGTFRSEEEAVSWIKGKVSENVTNKGRTIFRLSPQMKEEILTKGQPLYQNPMAPKGQIAFEGDRMRISPINPDASTAPHEASHAVRRMLQPEQMNEAENLFGSNWDVPAEEAFARGTESWLQRTGTTSPAMSNTMGFFNQNMSQIYQNPMEVPSGADQLYSRIFGITSNASPLDRMAEPGYAAPAAAGVVYNVLQAFNGRGGLQ